MSTIEECVRDEELIPVKARLWRYQLEERLIYASPESVAWIRDVLKDAKSDGFVLRAAKPIEQLDVLLRRFCSGEDLDDPLPHHMTPTSKGIWRIPTADLRLVGWFPVQSVFVLSEIELKSNCTGMRDEQLLSNAEKFREKLDLMNGDFVKGDLNECI